MPVSRRIPSAAALALSATLVAPVARAVAQTPAPRPAPAAPAAPAPATPAPAPAAAPTTPVAGSANAAGSPSDQGQSLSLAQALDLARNNSPTYKQSENGRRRASATLLGANGAFLPTVNANFGSDYREGRAQFFAGQAFGNTSGTLSSSIGANAQLNYGFDIVATRRAARAGVDAADADVGAAAATLRVNVTQQYMTALQQDARVRLQDTLLLSARAQLELARARAQVGVGTVLDVRRAEVTLGQVEVGRLQAVTQAEVERLRLLQQVGVEPRTEVRLTSTFAVTAPPLTLDDLLAQARRANPSLGAFQARERQAQLNVRAAQSQYLPSLNIQAGVGGFTQQQTDIGQVISQRRQGVESSALQCQQQQQLYTRVGLPFPGDCSQIAFTPADEAAIRSGNRAYPFRFTRNPYTLSAFISLPVFNGFQREQQIQTASAAERDAEYNRRGQELRLTADVTAAYRTMVTDQRVAELQQRNAQVAREALFLAEERYKVGASPLLDVLTARGDYERAQNDYINAVYQFQRDFAALENAVGRPLR